MPRRIQLPAGTSIPGAVRIDEEPWANPYDWRDFSDHPSPREVAIHRYCDYLFHHPEIITQARSILTTCDLVCECPLTEPCHGDVLLRLANARWIDGRNYWQTELRQPSTLPTGMINWFPPLWSRPLWLGSLRWPSLPLWLRYPRWPRLLRRLFRR